MPFLYVPYTCDNLDVNKQGQNLLPSIGEATLRLIWLMLLTKRTIKMNDYLAKETFLVSQSESKKYFPIGSINIGNHSLSLLSYTAA